MREGTPRPDRVVLVDSHTSRHHIHHDDRLNCLNHFGGLSG